MGTLAENFRKGYAAHLKQGGLESFMRKASTPIEDFLRDTVQDLFEETDAQERDMIFEASLAMLDNSISSEVGWICKLLKYCKSPIERVFVTSLWSLSVSTMHLVNNRPILLTPDGHSFGSEPFSLCNLTIEPQAKIANYFVDFRLTYVLEQPDFEAKDKAGIPGVKVRQNQIVVECDGHDFHERTKEQAAKDKSRDRALQTAGYKVFRYTGSEIWANPVKCATEVANCLEQWD